MPPHPPSNGKLDKSKGVDQVTVKKGSCRKEEVPCSTEDKSGGAVSAEVRLRFIKLTFCTYANTITQ